MKNKFIKSTLILIIGGFFTKLFSLLIKITQSRLLTNTSLGTYMLILPTFNLFITLSQFGLPLALSKLISENKKSSKEIFASITPFIIALNILLIIILIAVAPFISNNLLKNNSTLYPLLAIPLVIPFTTLSSLTRSYFFGKEKMFPHVISNIIEDLIRYILLILILPMLNKNKTEYIVTFLVLVNIISELSSTIILIIFLPKNIIINKEDLKPNKIVLKESLKISVPNTLSHLIGSISYFLEPILLTNLLIHNYSIDYITKEYGILQGYIIPLLLLPSFFTNAISSALLPSISKAYAKNNINKIKKLLNKAIIITLLISISITIFFEMKGKLLLKLIYKTEQGLNYLKILSIVFILEYLESPLIITLNAINKSKYNLVAAIISFTSRIIFLIIFSKYKIGLYSLVISLSLNIILTIIYLLIAIRKSLKNL